MLTKIRSWLFGAPIVAEPVMPPAPMAPVTAEPDRVRLAVYGACADVGIPVGQLQDDTDLVRTGKIYDVLHHAAARLGQDHRLRTVSDVMNYLRSGGQ